MNKPVIAISDLLLLLNKRKTDISRELQNLELTKEELSDSMKSAKTEGKEGINSSVRDMGEISLKSQYLNGRMQELTDLEEDLKKALGEALINGFK